MEKQLFEKLEFVLGSKEEFIEELHTYLHENPLPEIKSKEDVFLERDIPSEEDDRNEFKESFKADTIYHKLINSGNKKAAEARKHDCESKEHVVKKEVSVTLARYLSVLLIILSVYVK